MAYGNGFMPEIHTNTDSLHRMLWLHKDFVVIVRWYLNITNLLIFCPLMQREDIKVALKADTPS